MQLIYRVCYIYLFWFQSGLGYYRPPPPSPPSIHQLCKQARVSECPLWFTSTDSRPLHPALNLKTAVVLPVHLDSTTEFDDHSEGSKSGEYFTVRYFHLLEDSPLTLLELDFIFNTEFSVRKLICFSSNFHIFVTFLVFVMIKSPFRTPSRKGWVVNGHTAKAIHKWVHPPPLELSGIPVVSNNVVVWYSLDIPGFLYFRHRSTDRPPLMYQSFLSPHTDRSSYLPTSPYRSSLASFAVYRPLLWYTDRFYRSISSTDRTPLSCIYIPHYLVRFMAEEPHES